MGEGNSKRSKPSAWSLPSSSKLEADIAYFEARLSMLDEKPATCYQNAQRRAYSALESSLSETLERLRAQQRKRRKIRASSEVPLADQLDQTDIQSLLAEEAMQSLKQGAEGGGDARPPENPARAGVASPALGDPLAQGLDEARLGSGEAESAGRSATAEPEPAAPEFAAPEVDEEEEMEPEALGQFDSDNLYLRTALFSEHLSFLQEPEEVEEEWEDVEEAEIRENLGQLDLAEEPDLVDAGESMPLEASQPPEVEGRPSEQGRNGESDDNEDYSDSFFDSWLKE